MTEQFRQHDVSGNLIVDFRYHVVKVWEHPVQFWLDAGVGLAPLALLTNEANQNLAKAVDRLETCLIDLEEDKTTFQSLIGSSYVLCGLRYDPERTAEGYRRKAMLLEDSTTYQELLQKGESKGEANGRARGLVEGEHKFLLLQRYRTIWASFERAAPFADRNFRPTKT